MKQFTKLHKPTYKVHRLGGGLYAISYPGHENYGMDYIRRIEEGSRKYYFVNSSCPWFTTLRDAIMHIIFGG